MGLERRHWDPHGFGFCSGILTTEYIPKIRSVKIAEFESKIRSAQPSGARHIVPSDSTLLELENTIVSTAAIAEPTRGATIDNKVEAVAWTDVSAHLDEYGWAMVEKILTLPDIIADLRTALYGRLAPLANGWNESMGLDVRYPDAHVDFVERCHEAGQTRPTPLLLQYGAGDYNCLHQDLYGEHVFPFQVAFLLAEPGKDFTGGEFVLTEQRPRMQSRAEVVPLRRGDGVVFAVHHRPVRGARGVYRVNLRHGVSRLRSGRRHTVGVIFHDAT